jgi:Family of unknown function (DUF5995)
MTSTDDPATTGITTSIADVIARMQQIDSSLPAADGVACFNRMYLQVTQDVAGRLSQGFFSDPAFMEALDVRFANIYFTAIDEASGPPNQIPPAWQPLIGARSDSRIYPIQFALAGMNTHINHDLPIALVDTCGQLATAPDDGTHHADYQKVDTLLDDAEQSIRESFESGVALRTDRDVTAVLNLIANWSINSARDVAWDTAMALWMSRHVEGVEDLLMNSLARTVAMASRCLLVAP